MDGGIHIEMDADQRRRRLMSAYGGGGGADTSPRTAKLTPKLRRQLSNKGRELLREGMGGGDGGDPTEGLAKEMAEMKVAPPADRETSKKKKKARKHAAKKAKRKDGRLLPRTRSMDQRVKAAQRSRNFVAIAGSDCYRATERRVTTDRYYDKDTHQVTVTTRGDAHYRPSSNKK